MSRSTGASSSAQRLPSIVLAELINRKADEGLDFDIVTTLLSMLSDQLKSADEAAIRENWQGWVDVAENSKRAGIYRDPGTKYPGLIVLLSRDFEEATYDGLNLPSGFSAGCVKSGKLWRAQMLVHGRSQVILGAYNTEGKDSKHSTQAHVDFITGCLNNEPVQQWIDVCQSQTLDVSGVGGRALMDPGVKRASVDVEDWIETKLVEEKNLILANKRGRQAKFYATSLAEFSRFRAEYTQDPFLIRAVQFMESSGIYFTREGKVFQYCQTGDSLYSHCFRIGSEYPLSIGNCPGRLHAIYTAVTDEGRGGSKVVAARMGSAHIQRQGMLLDHKHHSPDAYSACPKIIQDMIRQGYCRRLNQTTVKPDDKVRILTILLECNASKDGADWLGEDSRVAIASVICQQDIDWLDAESCEAITTVINQSDVRCAARLVEYWVRVLVVRYLSGQISQDNRNWIKGVADVDPDVLLEFATSSIGSLPNPAVIDLFVRGANACYSRKYHDTLFRWLLEKRNNRLLQEVRAKLMAGWQGREDQVEGTAGRVFFTTHMPAPKPIAANAQSPEDTKASGRPAQKKRDNKGKRNKRPRREREQLPELIGGLLKLQKSLTELILDPSKGCGLKEVAVAMNASTGVWFSPAQVRGMQDIARKGLAILKKIPCSESDAAEGMLPLVFPSDEKPVVSLFALLLATERRSSKEESSLVEPWLMKVVSEKSASSAVNGNGGGADEEPSLALPARTTASPMLVHYLMVVAMMPAKTVALNIVRNLIGEGFSPAARGHGGFNAAEVAVSMDSRTVGGRAAIKSRGKKSKGKSKGRAMPASSPAVKLLQLLMGTGLIDLSESSTDPTVMTSPLITVLALNKVELLPVLIPHLPVGSIFVHPLSRIPFRLWDAATDEMRELLPDQTALAGKILISNTGVALADVQRYVAETPSQLCMGTVYVYLGMRIQYRLASTDADKVEFRAKLAEQKVPATSCWALLKEGVDCGDISVGEVHATVWMSLVACAVVMADREFLLQLLESGASWDVRMVFTSLDNGCVIGAEWCRLFEALTSLHIAALLGEMDCLVVLLQHGAVGVPAKHDMYPLDMFMVPRVVRFIVSAGVSKSSQTIETVIAEGMRNLQEVFKTQQGDQGHCSSDRMVLADEFGRAPATKQDGVVASAEEAARQLVRGDDFINLLSGPGCLGRGGWGGIVDASDMKVKQLFTFLTVVRRMVQNPETFPDDTSLQTLAESLSNVGKGKGRCVAKWRQKIDSTRFDTRTLEGLCALLDGALNNSKEIEILKHQERQGAKVQLSPVARRVQEAMRRRKELGKKVRLRASQSGEGAAAGGLSKRRIRGAALEEKASTSHAAPLVVPASALQCTGTERALSGGAARENAGQSRLRALSK